MASIRILTNATPINGPALFEKDQRMDRLMVKNYIGYHFEHIAREVRQELFVSRKIDVSPLFQGIQVLRQTKTDLDDYCHSLSLIRSGFKLNQLPLPVDKPSQHKYVYLNKDTYASFAEAQAMCKAHNLQLPEVYTEAQSGNLTEFLRANNINYCFAGIYPDAIDAIQRFVSTGLPVWESPHKKLIRTEGVETSMISVLDDLNVKFRYSNKGELVVSYDSPSIITDPDHKLGDYQYRDTKRNLSQLMSHVVCESRWDGSAYVYSSGGNPVLSSNITVFNRIERAAESLKSKSPATPEEREELETLMGFRSLKELCHSIASQAEEVEKDMFSKLEDLLSLSDISIHKEIQYMSETRRKRFPFLARFIFTNGIRFVWNLFGFIQKIKLNNRIKKIESDLLKTQQQANVNSDAIANMTSMIYGQSIAIDQLRIATADLDRRVTILEKKVEGLAHTLGGVVNKLESVLSLELVANLIARIQQSMHSGYTVLKEIVHCSLHGETSPLLLPAGQIRIIQHELRELSDGILDTDFGKMKSIIVSDPNDNHLLLVVINTAVLSNKGTELVKLVPLPYYEKDVALFPVLDYDTIILDQEEGTYSILNPQEEHDCLMGRCYVSDVEHSLSEVTCGIPQLFESKPSDNCMMEEIKSDGIFLKPMLPDGILYAVREEVTIRLFCQNDKGSKRTPKPLKGMGVLQLPSGCSLSVHDGKHRPKVIRGSPLFRLIDVEDVNLMPNGPLVALQSFAGNDTLKKASIKGSLWADHMTDMVQRVTNVDSRLNNQSQYIWSLIGLICTIAVGIIAAVLAAYKYSSGFRITVRMLRDKFNELQELLPGPDSVIKMGRGNPPPTAPKPSPHDFDQRARFHGFRPIQGQPTYYNAPSPYVSLGGGSRGIEPYATFRPSQPIGRVPLSTPIVRRCYPELASNWDQSTPAATLKRESREAEDLCKREPLLSNRPSNI